MNHLIPLTHQAPALIGAAGERAQMRFRASSSTCRPHPQHGGWTPSSTMRSYRRAIDEALDRCNRLTFSEGFKRAIAGRPISVRYVDDRRLDASP